MGTPPATTLRARAVDVVLWTLSFVLLGTLATLSLVPSPPLGGSRPVDLMLHVAAYAPTSFVLLLAAVWRPGRGPGRFPGMAWWLVGALLALGAGLEAVQGMGLIGPRQGEAADLVANTLGVGVGLGAWSLLRLLP